jgi:hypothetical protein
MVENNKITIEESLEKLYALKKLQEKELNLKAAAITDKIIKALEKRRPHGSSSERGAGKGKQRKKT